MPFLTPFLGRGLQLSKTDYRKIGTRILTPPLKTQLRFTNISGGCGGLEQGKRKGIWRIGRTRFERRGAKADFLARCSLRYVVVSLFLVVFVVVVVLLVFVLLLLLFLLLLLLHLSFQVMGCASHATKDRHIEQSSAQRRQQGTRFRNLRHEATALQIGSSLPFGVLL